MRLSGAPSPVAAVAASGGFSGFVPARGEGLEDGSSRHEGSLREREAAGAAQLVGAIPARTIGWRATDSGGREDGSSYNIRESDSARAAEAVTSDGSHDRVWGFRGPAEGGRSSTPRADSSTSSSDRRYTCTGVNS